MSDATHLINAFERVLLAIGLTPAEAQIVIKHGFVALLAARETKP